MELQGDGFILREWHLTDAESLHRSADNRNVSRYLMDRFPFPYTMTDAVSWVQRLQNQDPVINFAIVVDDDVVGGIGLEFREDIYRKTPLLGYWLSEYYWGLGIMTTSVKLITDYAFNQLGVMSIVTYALSPNIPSMRVMEKCGFKKAGVIPQSVIKDGQVMDEHIYSLIRG